MESKNLLEIWVVNGGILMLVLIPCSILLVAAMIRMFIRLNRSRVLPPYLLAKARETRNLNDRLEFARNLEGQRSPLGRAVRSSLRHIDLKAVHRPHRRYLDERISESVAFVADDLFDSLEIFSTLYTLGPLLGLLGTVQGMVRAFLVFASQKEKDLGYISTGIQNALITTLWGLAIAIPAYFLATHFYKRIRTYEREDLPEKALEIVEALYPDVQAGPESEGASSAQEATMRFPADGSNMSDTTSMDEATIRLATPTVGGSEAKEVHP